MSLTFKVKTTLLQQECGAEEAEALLEWLLANPKGSVNLKKCTHMHAAVLQTLMRCKPAVSVYPESNEMAGLIQASGLPSSNA